MGRYVKFCTFLKIYYTVIFQDSLLNDNTIVIFIFQKNVFKLWLCDLLQYQNHKKFSQGYITKTQVYITAAGCEWVCKMYKNRIDLSTAELAYR
jgi:hypothetical protein